MRGTTPLLALSKDCQQQIPALSQSDVALRTTRTLIAVRQDDRAAGLCDLDATGLVPNPLRTGYVGLNVGEGLLLLFECFANKSEAELGH